MKEEETKMLLKRTFTPAAESHGLWPWMNAPTFGRPVPSPAGDVAPLGR
jgi:hypothetical protein